MSVKFLPKIFLLTLIGAVLWLCYLIFKPFIIEIIAAVILVSIFYTPFEWLVKKLKGRKGWAALIMCIVVTMIVIVPIINLIIYGAQKSVEAYSDTITYLDQRDINTIINEHPLKNSIIEKVGVAGVDAESLKGFILNSAKSASNWLVAGAKKVAGGTFNFILSLVIIIFTMYFFFVDGQKMSEKLMHWTPLQNKYDRELFKKFQDVSSSVMISTFVTAIAQGMLGAIGFMIVGLPAFFAGVFMGMLSLLPYVGAAIVWLPAGIYLLVIGKIWQGVVLLLWGSLLVSTIDNVIRAYLIKDKAQVHPVFVIFSILGGISLFGFWGVVLGPLVISLFVTLMHIYEMEYEEVLE